MGIINHSYIVTSGKLVSWLKSFAHASKHSKLSVIFCGS